MVDLKDYYNTRVKSLDSGLQLEQVGHTVGGKAISNHDFSVLVSEIVRGLNLISNDNLLDLCCGNGVITKALSSHCSTVSAVDLSEELIEVAAQKNFSPNIEYFIGDILQLDKILEQKQSYSKILLFAALQHFPENRLADLLVLLQKFSTEDFRLYLGFIPDKERRWAFYDTFGKKFKYMYRRLSGTDVMGAWYKKSYIKQICDEQGLHSEFVDIPYGEYGHAYRFHAVISPAIADKK